MSTTVFVRGETHAALRDLKARLGAASLDAVIQRLLQAGQPDAKELFRDHREAVKRVCSKHKVRQLVAFGSRTRGTARPDSDLDLAAVVDRKLDLWSLQDLEEDLAAAFGLTVDLVLLPTPNKRLAARIERDGVPLVG